MQGRSALRRFGNSWPLFVFCFYDIVTTYHHHRSASPLPFSVISITMTRLPSPPPLRPSNAVRHITRYVRCEVLATCSYGPPPISSILPFQKETRSIPCSSLHDNTYVLKRLRKARPFFQPVASHLSSRLSVVFYASTYVRTVHHTPYTCSNGPTAGVTCIPRTIHGPPPHFPPHFRCHTFPTPAARSNTRNLVYMTEMGSHPEPLSTCLPIGYVHTYLFIANAISSDDKSCQGQTR